MPSIERYTLEHYVRLINSNTNFSLARYFDGEWNIITGRRGLPDRTGGGHLYFPRLRRDLYESIVKPHTDPQYYYGTWYNIALSGHYSSQFCIDNNVKIKWYNGYIMHSSSMEGQLFPLIKALRNREIIFVGPESLRNAESLFPIKHYIPIIERDCYTQKDDMVKRTIKVSTKDSVILVHASLAGKVVVYDLFKSLGTKCTIIDAGSIWNIFCDKANMRGWWKKLKDSNPKRFKLLYNSNLGIY